MDLQKLDLKMLHCLEVLVSEAHVTRAAERLGMSQPRLSSTLSRLRHVLADPLLVRTQTGLRPTPYAVEIANRAREFLSSIETTLGKKGEFDPTTASRAFNIASPDALIELILAPSVGKIRREAPGVSISLSMPPINEVISNLKTGQADLAVAFISAIPDDFYTSKIGEIERVCIVSADHPTIANCLSLQQFADSGHVAMTFGHSYLLAISDRIIVEALRKRGYERQIVVFVQGMLSIPEIVARSNLIAVVPRQVGVLAQKQSNVKLLPLPFECPKSDISLIWHKRLHDDAAHTWLRNTIRNSASSESKLARGRRKKPSNQGLLVSISTAR